MPQPTTDAYRAHLALHMFATHCNLAALDLDLAELQRQHHAEHHEAGGLTHRSTDTDLTWTTERVAKLITGDSEPDERDRLAALSQRLMIAALDGPGARPADDGEPLIDEEITAILDRAAAVMVPQFDWSIHKVLGGKALAAGMAAITLATEDVPTLIEKIRRQNAQLADLRRQATTYGDKVHSYSRQFCGADGCGHHIDAHFYGAQCSAVGCDCRLWHDKIEAA